MFEEALKRLRSGRLVAIPTETVYGLAAPIDQLPAIESIFTTKERPFFDPLIVHVSSIAQAQTLTTQWTEICTILAQEFWPGPLTLVLPKDQKINPMITSGLETVGIRWPKHSLTQQLIEDLGVPLAAPSANKFGRTSPTTAEHVKSEFKSEDVWVLDGGACQIGLESTVLSVTAEGELSLLRAGSISKTEISKVLEKNKTHFVFVETKDKKLAPGQMKHHYMPAVPLIVVKNKSLSENEIIQKFQEKVSQLPKEVEGVKLVIPQKIQTAQCLNLAADARLAARQFYAELRNLASSGADFIYIFEEAYFQSEDWSALNDRLSKAASLVI